MTAENTDQSKNGIAHFLRRALVGDNSRNAIDATAVGIVLVLCVTIIQFSLVQPLLANASYRWTATGIHSMLFFACLVAIAAVYSYSGGGLIDCCVILLVPLFLSNVTIVSVAPTTGNPVPIWQWSFDQWFVQNIRTAIYGALLWGSGLGTAGFLFGTMFRAFGRVNSDQSQANQTE